MSVVYFVQSAHGGQIKIGVASNLASRLTSLRNGNPAPLLVLTAIPGTHADEKRLHRLFAHQRTVREWFLPDAPLTDFIEALKAGVDPSEAEARAQIQAELWLADKKQAVAKQLSAIQSALRAGFNAAIEGLGVAKISQIHGVDEKTVRRWRHGATPYTTLGLNIIFSHPQFFGELFDVAGVRIDALGAVVDDLRERMKVRAAG
jgi:Meiotically Up-regulated Gene 113 (MUG113) protein